MITGSIRVTALIDAVTIQISNENISFKKSDKVIHCISSISVFDGSERIYYDGEGLGSGFSCSDIPSTEQYVVSGSPTDDGFEYQISIVPNSVFSVEIPFHVKYRGVLYEKKINLSVLEDGESSFYAQADLSSVYIPIGDDDLPITEEGSTVVEIKAFYGERELDKSEYSISLESLDNSLLSCNVIDSLKQIWIQAVENSMWGLNTKTVVKVSVTHKLYGSRSVSIVVIPNFPGLKGKAGPKIRTRDWVPNLGYFSGSDGEEFLDIVFYKPEGASKLIPYKCKRTHRRESITPDKSTNWEEAQTWDFVATDLIMSDKIYARLLDAKYIIAEDGFFDDITANNVNISGRLNAVSGSFTSLRCVTSGVQGRDVGGISFGNDGNIDISGDWYHQGNNSQGRGYRFYANNIIGRGIFASKERITLEVNGSSASVYVDGISRSPTSFNLNGTQASDGNTYYRIECYGGSLSSYSGFPIDTIVINNSARYIYEIALSESQRVCVINANNNDKNTYIYINGVATPWFGGVAGMISKFSMFQYPKNNGIGAGLFVIGMHDNNWK